ncbi:MAG: transporter [Acidithiobacillales bacterium]
MKTPVWHAIGLFACAFLALAGPGAAQDLEPRAYSPSPVGVNFALVGFARSTGGVITDPTLPISDVSAHINGFIAGYGRAFGLLGRQALITAALPYAWGDVEGNVFEERRRVTRSGLTDLRAKLSVNLYGNPALTPQDFAKQSRGVIVGASFAMWAPTGQYDQTKLINLGTNRWAFKPEVGVSFPLKKFDFDLYAGAVFFTENPNFFPGNVTRHQDPVGTVQLHASYSFRQAFWLAVDGTWYGGGASHVNDGPPTGRLSNTRVGVTLSVPLGKRQSAKVSYSRGASVRAGSDFDIISAAWQILWF